MTQPSQPIRVFLQAVGLFGLMALLTKPWGCVVQERCYEHRDCPGAQICDTVAGICVSECETNADCGGDDFYCEGNSCHFVCPEQDQLSCPETMVSVCGSFCIDQYEASRPDATETTEGTDESQATSRAGVLPWYSTDLRPDQAAVACEAAGKRLCSPEEWEAACAGTGEHTYTYGDHFEPETCNSIDTYCDPACGVYHDCWRDCDHDHHIMPTGSFIGCISSFGPFDMSGNVWEAVESNDGAEHFRGGAYDCGDPGLAHTCGYDGIVAGTFPHTRGFRCCSNGEPS